MAGKQKVICCVGDSLTEGDYGIRGSSGIANVKKENYPFFLAQLTGADVRNFGRSGSLSHNALGWYVEGGYRVADADIIIILLGTNGGHTEECTSREDVSYLELLDRFKKDAPQAKIYICTPPHCTENPAYSNCGFAEKVSNAVKFVRKTAEKYGYPLIDLAADPHFTAETEDVMLPNDGLHFGELGYRTLAQIIYEAIKKDL